MVRCAGAPVQVDESSGVSEGSHQGRAVRAHLVGVGERGQQGNVLLQLRPEVDQVREDEAGRLREGASRGLPRRVGEGGGGGSERGVGKPHEWLCWLVG